MIPEYVDHHISELILYKIATETGYVPVADPPNWDSVWDEEMSILKEFEYQISIEKLDSQVLNTSGLGHKRRHRIAPVFFYCSSTNKEKGL